MSIKSLKAAKFLSESIPILETDRPDVKFLAEKMSEILVKELSKPKKLQNHELIYSCAQWIENVVDIIHPEETGE